MKRLVLMVVVEVVGLSVFSYGRNTSYTIRGTKVDVVQFSGVDSIEIDGVDTTISDTFAMGSWGYVNFEILASQADDSVDIDSIILETSIGSTRRNSDYEIFSRHLDVDGSATYCKLLSGISDTGLIEPDTLSNFVQPPLVNRARLKIYTGTDAGENLILKINRIHAF